MYLYYHYHRRQDHGILKAEVARCISRAESLWRKNLDSWTSQPLNELMSDYKIVYSDDPNFKKRCLKYSSYPCVCPKASHLNPSEYTLKIRLEKNARGGKSVTVIFELPDNEAFFEELSKKLKKLCGTGGTFKKMKIEIQGDHREKIKLYLEKMGFKIKLAGG